MGVFLNRGKCSVRDLPAGCASEGNREQFIHESGHRLAPAFRFVEKSAYHVP